MDKDILDGMTEEEAWGLAMDEVMAIPREMLFGPVAEERVGAEEQEALFAVLGKPTGVGLPSGMVGEMGPAIRDVHAGRGDYVVENGISPRGLRRMTVARLGSGPGVAVYYEQVRACGGRGLMYAESVNEETKVHQLAMVWRVD